VMTALCLKLNKIILILLYKFLTSQLIILCFLNDCFLHLRQLFRMFLDASRSIKNRLSQLNFSVDCLPSSLSIAWLAEVSLE
jgi:hypothetical protein